MVAEPHSHYITPEEYLAIERAAETKSEYYHGRMYAMAGASGAHNRLVMNTAGLLHAQLRGHSCEAMMGDMRVKISAHNVYTYPDVLVGCDPVRFDDESENTMLNPHVLFEVLSPSTEAYDRGLRFELYQSLESLTDYILVAQDRMHVDHYRRQPDNRWLLQTAEGPDAEIVLEAIGCRLKLGDVYERVQFPAEALPLRT